MSYACIAIDPPWPERGGGRVKRGADRHYRVLGVNRIIQVVQESPAWRPAESAHLWLWATKSHLHNAMHVMMALGFGYVTSVVWVKMRDRHPDVGDYWQQASIGVALAHLQVGLGQYARGAHEHLLLGTRGKAMVPAPANRLPDVLFAERTRHSAKPAEAYALIERVSPGPRLELFARGPRAGWDVWGDEATTAPLVGAQQET